ncbi:MAG: hypothetical protein IBX69_07535 [Anaerolineales bacterium]|nr:hypothetical protein [Anaerolineales bacterium]
MIQYLHPNPLPSLIVHADWSTNPQKRIMARAVKNHKGSYTVKQPEMVGDLNSFFSRLKADVDPGGCILVGFDFPIGIPLTYARAAGLTSFLSALPKFGRKDWADFYLVAETPNQIHLKRPFYPNRAGSARRFHLLDGLGFDDLNSLFRLCEHGREGRRTACPLFWTLGPQQVGKAAISGWNEVLVPALGSDLEETERSHPLRIWPFSGSLQELLQTEALIVAETYPPEFYTHFKLNFKNPITGKPSGKRDQVVRASNAGILISIANILEIQLEPALRADLLSGFGPSQSGEDTFDAIIGLLGMLNILSGKRPFDDPDDFDIRHIEGWIFGQLRNQDHV